MNAAGDFVIIWGSLQQDGSNWGVYGQRYDSSGTALGGEFLVNTSTVGGQGAARVSMADDGSFAVVWTDTIVDGSAIGVLGQRFDATGGKVGSEFVVNSSTTMNQNFPDIAMAADGSFLVVWGSDHVEYLNSGTSHVYEVYGQLFASNGNTVGGEFLISTLPAGSTPRPSVALEPGGTYLVAWESEGHAGDTKGIYAQRLDASGNPVGGEFLVSDTISGTQDYPRVAADPTGGFGVVWDGAGSGDTSGIFMQRLREPSLTYSIGDGAADATMTFRGTVADVNAALNGLTYTPNLGYNGSDTLVLTTDDLGNTGSGGAMSDVDTVAITVGTPNQAPTADAGGPYTVIEGGSFTLDGTGSSDPEGDSLTYSWDLNNDGTYGDTSGASTLVDWAKLQTYGIADSGTYTIGLRVDDGNGNVATSTTTLTVTNAAPTLSVTGAATADQGSTYTLNLSASDPGDDTITSWTINWGDGSIDTLAGNPSSATHVYTQPGLTYDITVSATDEDGTFTSSNLVVASRQNNTFYLLDGNTGAVVYTLQPTASLNGAAEVIFGPDGHIYTVSNNNDSVLKYDGTTGDFLGVFVASGAGGLDNPQALVFGPDGNLYVGSYNTNEVLRYDGTTGAYIDTFIAAGTGGLAEPNSLQFGQDGDLYVGSWVNHNVSRFDGQTGAFIEVVADVGASQFQTDFAFGPDGLLYVGHTTTLYEEIKVFDPATGTEVNSIEVSGIPYAIAFGPDGYLYASKWTGDKVEVWDTTTESLVRVFADSSIGLDNTWGIAFSPAQQVYVNAANQAPVNSVPGDQTTAQDTPLEFSTGNGNAITVTDPDAGSGEIEVTLSVDTGTLTVNPVVPMGSETLLNSSVAGTQTEPDIAYAADGSYVAVWQDSSGLDGDLAGVYAQRFDASGAKVGGEFLVNTSTANSQFNASIAMDDAGNFVVAWTHRTNGGSTQIRAQRFDSAGVKQGSEFTVNTQSQGNQFLSDVAMDASGNFVVAWYGNGPGDDEGVFIQRYDAAGNELGGETLVNTTTTDDQQYPRLAMDAAGNFVVVWESNLQDGSARGIYGQRFDASGVKQGGEFQINTTSADNQTGPSVAMDSAGNFVVVWESNLQDGSGTGVYGRQYYANGTPVAGEFRINETTASSQRQADVAMTATGEFVVTWASQSQDGSDFAVVARRFDSAGNALSKEVVVNTTTTGGQSNPNVDVLDSGDFVVAWFGNGPGDDVGVFAQRFAPVSFSVGDGLADSTMTFSGTLAAVNAVLEGLTYTPPGGYNGSATLTITTDDQGNTGAGGARSDVDTVGITVTGSDQAPTAVADSATVAEAGTVAIDLASNDVDPEGQLDLTSIQIVSGPSNGSVVVNGDGTVSYAHDGSETSSDSFTYTIRDVGGNVSNTATVSLTVTPQNDPPSAVADSATVLEGGSVGIDLAANDTDPDNALDLTSIQIVSGPHERQLQLHDQGRQRGGLEQRHGEPDGHAPERSAERGGRLGHGARLGPDQRLAGRQRRRDGHLHARRQRDHER
jgi:hypothetical protein